MTNKKFLAPEQRYSPEECNAQGGKKLATVKADTWKIPDLTKILLKNNFNNEKQDKQLLQLLSSLQDIHKLCKDINPEKRCTSKQILQEYRRVYLSMQDNMKE